MPSDVKQKMESVFNTDFSNVRIHTGGRQAESVGALAFTTGSDIYFAQGRYNPNTSYGQKLLAHELTHVVQQKQGRVKNPFGGGIAVVQNPGLEAEAERMSVHVGNTKGALFSNNMRVQNKTIQPMKKFINFFSNLLYNQTKSYSKKIDIRYLFDKIIYKEPEVYEVDKPKGNMGSFNTYENIIKINKNLSSASKQFTFKHEKSHWSHYQFNKDLYDDPVDILISEVVARNRECIATLEKLKKGWKPITGEDLANVKIAEMYLENPNKVRDMVLDHYAVEYQNKFLEINLKKIASEIKSMLNFQGKFDMDIEIIDEDEYKL